MKKNYVQPNIEVALIKIEYNLLDGSEINNEKSGNDDMSKDDLGVMGKEDITW